MRSLSSIQETILKSEREIANEQWQEPKRIVTRKDTTKRETRAEAVQTANRYQELAEEMEEGMTVYYDQHSTLVGPKKERSTEDEEGCHCGKRTMVGRRKEGNKQACRHDKQKELVAAYSKQCMMERCTMMASEDGKRKEKSAQSEVHSSQGTQQLMRKEALHTLVEITPVGVNAVEEAQQWKNIEIAVDSGAAKIVVG